jgi:hypothetical protein
MEILHDPHQLGVPSGVSKMISEAMVCLVQTVDLSCIETNTSSKWTKTIVYMTHVTKEFHRVRPKRFLKLWYIWCKLWIYLAPILTLSQTDWNEILHDPRHLGVPSGASKMIPNLRYVWRKPCIYLESSLALFPIEPKWASIWASAPRSIIRCVQNDFLAYGMFGANYAPILHWN